MNKGTLLHASDPHFGAADPAIAESFLATAQQLRPDLTVLSGDFSMRARRDELEAGREFSQRLPEPKCVIPGNHDIPAINHLWDRFFRPFRQYRRFISENLEPEWQGAGLHVLGLNSNRPFGFHRDWSEGRISGTQRERIREVFSRSPEDALRVLVLHHPLLRPEGVVRETVKPLPPLLEVLGETEIDVVLCGHYHLSLIRQIDCGNGWRCWVSQAATVCSTRLQGEPQGFHLISYEGRNAAVERWVYRDAGFAPAAREGLGKEA